jgi:2'-5' RNA ligase
MRADEDIFYFALQPPPEAGQAAQARLAAVARRPVRAMPVARLHVSLAGVPGPLVADPGSGLSKAAERIRIPPFRVSFNRVGSWGRGGGVLPVVAWGDEGVIGVDWLHDALHAVLRPGPPRPICPHMTLAREATAIPEQVVSPITWWARDFVLLQSGGGRTRVLGRWPLRA